MTIEFDAQWHGKSMEPDHPHLMEDRSHSFKLSYLPLFAIIGPATALVALEVLIAKSGIAVRPVAMVTSLFATLALSLLLALVMADITRIVVTPRGLLMPDYSGRQRLVEWLHIITVRPTRFAGLKFLRLLPRDSGRVPWLPLFLADMAGFKASVFQHAEAGNPLAAYLRAASADQAISTGLR